ncbi:MAG: hypothetical protein JW995_07320 [Melioribacteraceae bacterium]|nr:hypothetical protein [Melioribacteraceae bacterium]
MKRQYFIPLIIISLLLIRCEKDSPTSSGEDETNTKTASVGTAGGNVSNDFVEVSVPPGSFSSETELNLSIAENEGITDENTVSPTYILQGIPETYTQPITIKIKKPENADGENFISAGTDGYIKSINSILTGYTILYTNEDSGSLVCQLPVPSGDDNTLSKVKSGGLSVFLQVLTGKTTISSGGHFEIFHPVNTAQQDVDNLAQYLEEAYTKIMSLGFSYSSRTNYPVKVTLRKMDSAEFGHSVASIWGDNHGTLEFNTLKISDSKSMRLTAGHEFFHLIQGLYDPRNRISKAKFAPAHLWLDEATAVWSEEKFSDEAGYSSSVRDGQITAPFKGMGIGPIADAQGYGYGMSGLIKYLGESSIIDIYNKIRAGSHPIESVTISVDDPASYWWRDFLNKYLSGQVYNDVNPLTIASDNDTQIFEFASSSDTLKEFSSQCSDLSAALFNVKLKLPYVEEGTHIKFNLTPDPDLNLLLYKYKGSVIEKIGEGQEEVIVNDIRSLNDDGWYFLAMVTNHRWLNPYVNMKAVNLKVSLAKDETIDFSKYKYCAVGLFNSSVVQETSNNYEYTTERNYSIPYAKTEGSFSGNIFTADWDIQDAYPKRSGQMSITVDPVTLVATNISISETQDDNASFTTYEIDATNVPLIYYADNLPSTLSGELRGNDACAGLTNFAYNITSQTSAYWERTKSVSCSSNTVLIVVFKEY